MRPPRPTACPGVSADWRPSVQPETNSARPGEHGDDRRRRDEHGVDRRTGAAGPRCAGTGVTETSGASPRSDGRVASAGRERRRSSNEVRADRQPGSQDPRPTPVANTRTTVSRPTDPSWSGRTLKKPTIARPSGSDADVQQPQRDQRAEQADQRALEHERPADERVGRADEPHDLDLLGPRDDGETDRVDDDEQHDRARRRRPSRRPAVRTKSVTVSTRFTSAVDVEDVADDRVARRRALVDRVEVRSGR